MRVLTTTIYEVAVQTYDAAGGVAEGGVEREAWECDMEL